MPGYTFSVCKINVKKLTRVPSGWYNIIPDFCTLSQVKTH